MKTQPMIAPVEGQPDLIRFEADLGFQRDAKALTEGAEYEKYADQLEEGDLLIAGWGANFEMDRQDESFMPGSFDRGLKAFLEGEATLAYHHDHKIALGKVLDAYQVEGKGVRVVARVDSQPDASPHRHLYEQVRKGTLNALSCGGFFRRKLTKMGQRISDVDLTEWSITPVPVGRGCNFAVVGAKALDAAPDLEVLDESEEDDISDEEFKAILDRLGSLYTKPSTD